MKLIYVIFDKKIFKTSQPAREWLDISGFEPIERVITVKDKYKYKVGKRKKKGKMKAFNIANGVTYVYE